MIFKIKFIKVQKSLVSSIKEEGGKLDLLKKSLLIFLLDYLYKGCYKVRLLEIFSS